MEASASIPARDLTLSQRQLVAELLHVDPSEQDARTVILHRPEEQAAADHRARVRARLRTLMQRVGERTKDVPEAKIEAAVNEGMEFVRRRPDHADHR